jgi:hypothetical protein
MKRDFSTNLESAHVDSLMSVPQQLSVHEWKDAFLQTETFKCVGGSTIDW